jgi:selenide,water dikinase
LANVVLPPGDPDAQQRALSDLLAGARQEFTAMGASLVGGHTIVGPRMELGFTVIGKSLGRKLVRKGNLRVGDRLVLTKPIGTGVLLAAHMQSRCSAKHYQQLLDRMLERQHPWSQVTNDCDIEAGTDITGFGLAGHLLEMLQPSEVAAVIDLDAVPFLPGAVEASASGIESTLAPSNRSVDASIQASETIRKQPQYSLLFDPQTCGGLLFGVPEERLSQLIDAAEATGLPTPVTIGQVVAHQDAWMRVE